MKKLSDYQAIIVDLDGTLYYQKPVRAAIFKEMVLHFWRLQDFLIVYRYRKMYEHGLNEHERFAKLPERAPEVVKEWMILRPLRYLSKYRDSVLIGLLRQVGSIYGTVIVYSDYPVKEKLCALQYVPDQAYTASDVKCLKPNATGFLRLLDSQGIDPHKCLVIGDREEKDGLLAANLGAEVIILPAKQAKRKELYNHLLV